MSSRARTRRKLHPLREDNLPRSVIAVTVITVFAVNLFILGYAMSISRPTAHAGGPEAIELAAGDDESGLPDRVPLPMDVVGAALEDDDEWALEPITVVNIFEVPSLEEVQPLFLHHCAGCHGLDGRGDGPAAEYLLPRPRDFFHSQFRYASTIAEREHVLVDLQRTITRGVPRSAMPGFGGVLTETEIAGLARYVLDIREKGEQFAAPAEPIDVGERPPLTPPLLARGRELFTSLSCNTCHGDSGRGDGMNAESLVDFRGRPVRPADFTSGLFKTGQTPEDLCRTILRGVSGTPMVAYEAVLVQENEDGTMNTMDAWALVNHIRSFAPQPRPAGIPSGAVIAVEPAAHEGMLCDPVHAGWLGIDPVLVAIKPLQTCPERPTLMEIRAVRTNDRIAICLEWRDGTLDVARDEGVYADAAAVTFALGDDVPPLSMEVALGPYAPKEPVNTWYWRADRQLDASLGRRHPEITMAQGHGEAWYLFVKGPDARLPRVTSVEEGPSTRADDPALVEHSVWELNARGLGRIMRQPVGSQSAFGTAAWSIGTWRVVMERSLGTEDELDVQLTSARRIPVSFAIWDGAKGDHGGIKLASSWHWLELKP